MLASQRFVFRRLNALQNVQVPVSLSSPLQQRPLKCTTLSPSMSRSSSSQSLATTATPAFVMSASSPLLRFFSLAKAKQLPGAHFARSGCTDFRSFASKASSTKAVKAADDEVVAEMSQPEDSANLDEVTDTEDSDVESENEGGSDPKYALKNFEISPPLMETLQNNFNIQYFYPIQAMTFAPVLSGKDIIGKSKTGTGKTLAFVLPLIERLVREGTRTPPGYAKIVILEPTRELAKQVAREIEKLSPKTSVATVYGGVSYQPQVQALRQGVDVLIATPGRCIDHINQGNVDLSQVQTIVLDEADEMLRIGFTKDVETIMSCMPSVETGRQTVLFSATIPSWVQQLTKKYMRKDAVLIDAVGQQKDQTPSLIAHKTIVSRSSVNEKAAIIAMLMKAYTSKDGRVIIFTDTKHEADELSKAPELQAKASAIHGDISQSGRELVLSDFRHGNVKAMIATDVAARGLDIPNVELVVQCSIPKEKESYIHRSGRTGRAGNKGICVLMYLYSDRSKINRLERDIGVKFEQVRYNDIMQLDVDVHVTEIRAHADRFLQGQAAGSHESIEKMAASVVARFDQDPVQAVKALLHMKYKHLFTSRSLLTGRENYTTLLLPVVDANRTSLLVKDRLFKLTGKRMQFGHFESTSSGTVIEVADADLLHLQPFLLQAHKADPSPKMGLPEELNGLQIMQELPKELFRGGRYDDKDYGWGSKGGLATSGYGGGGRDGRGGGGRSSRGGFGRDRGDEYGGGRHGGGRFGRQESYGEDRTFSRGRGDRDRDGNRGGERNASGSTGFSRDSAFRNQSGANRRAERSKPMWRE